MINYTEKKIVLIAFSYISLSPCQQEELPMVDQNLFSCNL